MAVMDEFKEERERMKTQPFKKRFAYFWDYHKYHVLAGAFVLFFVVDLIYTWITAKDTVFAAALINCYADTEQAEIYEENLSLAYGIDMKEEEIMLNTDIRLTGEDATDYETVQLISVRVAAHEIDVMMTDKDTFDRYSKTDMFYDLRTVLSPEQLEYYKDSFYYIDYALIENDYYENFDYATTEFVDTLDHSSPEGMEKPIPVGIYVTPSEEFSEYYRYGSDKEIIFGIAGYVADRRLEYSLQFLDTVTGRITE